MRTAGMVLPLLSILLLLLDEAASFLRAPTSIGKFHQVRVTRSGQHGKSVPCLHESSQAESTRSRQETSTVPMESALTSLEKLLAQQKKELSETERLLELLRSSENGPGHILDEGIFRPLSTARSLLSGFDYGFQSRSEGASSMLKPGLRVEGLAYGGPPGNIVALGSQQFMRNWNAILGEYREEVDVDLSTKQKELQAKLSQLTLNSTAIWERELQHGPIQAPWIIKAPYLLVCFLLDVVFENRYVPSRFFLLETVARMPYFSYITMLHLYETLGFWRRSADMKRVHFAEEINEYRHLLIMESLGGDQSWWVRFMAQHSAIVYYIVLCILWAISPSLSYRFSELLENHAVNTYSVFLDENEYLLKELPPSIAAIEYYSFGLSDSMYAEFQTNALLNGEEIRQPGVNMTSLYDVFRAICADEGDHVKTMQACLDTDVSVRSLSMEKKILTGIALASAVSFLLSTGDPSSLVESDVAASSVVPLDAVLDAAVAGAAGIGQQLMEEEEAAFVLGGTTELLRRLGWGILEFLGRFLPFL